MSRRRDPRRFRLVPIAVWGAVCGAFCFALLGMAPAEAQTGSRLGAGGGMRLVVGGYRDTRTCEQSALVGGQDEAGIAACDRALSGDPLTRRDRAALLFNRGVMHLRRQEGRAALADFDAVLAIDREMGEAYLNRAAALAQMGEYGAAVASITAGLSLGVREPHKAYFNRGAAREALGDLRGALEDYSTALEIKPDWGPAEQEIARFIRSRRSRLAQMLGGERAGDQAAPAVP